MHFFDCVILLVCNFFTLIKAFMCGILFSCRDTRVPSSDKAPFIEELLGRLHKLNSDRGPDAQDSYTTYVSRIALHFFSSELRLRGDSLVRQPHVSEDGHTLCWNGEIFEGIQVRRNENDGVILFKLLQATRSVDEVINVLGNLEGPYAIVYYHPTIRSLFFARDPLGRRSLLIHTPNPSNPLFILSSVSAGPSNSLYQPEELSTEYIYVLDVGRLGESADLSQLKSYLQVAPRGSQAMGQPFAKPPKVNQEVPNDPPKIQDLDHIPPHLLASIDGLIAHLDKSVMLQTHDIPQRSHDKGAARVAVLFSGGIDSTMIAYFAHRHVSIEEPLDLLNVAFENPRKILVQAEGNIGSLPKRERKQKLKDRPAYSTIDISYEVPDRITGREELEELRRLCPGRVWNFVEVDVPYEDSQSARAKVETLMYPGRTVMDMSLAIALYFAAHGVGRVRSHPNAIAQPYTSPAKVLLNGLGSDELLGGYGRHRTAFKMGGWQAIIRELQLEIDRIPARNLGRDDRVISSHGKETRHPFLSLTVVDFLARLPVHHKLDPRLEQGVGEKVLLRLAARKLGLVEASVRKKRAMQFGSHSARMEGGRGEKKGDLMLQE